MFRFFLRTACTRIMSRAALWTGFSFILVLWKSQDVNSCACFPTHPQKLVCNADFVFWGDVIKKTLENTSSSDPNNNLATRVYTVTVRRVFKGSLSAEVKLETMGNSAACGVNLKKDQSYVIAGHEVHKEKRINICNFIRRTDNLTRRRRRMLFGFLRRYLHYCSCKDIPTTGVSVTKGCKLPKESKAIACYFANGICRRRRTRRKRRFFCGWTPRVLKMCGSPE